MRELRSGKERPQRALVPLVQRSAVAAPDRHRAARDRAALLTQASVPGARDHALTPPGRIRRQALRERVRAELVQRARIDAALEVDDVVHRVPPVDPAPAVELRRLLGRVEAQRRIPGAELQEVPALLLADAERARVAAHELRRQAVAQPVPRARDFLDLLAAAGRPPRRARGTAPAPAARRGGCRPAGTASRARSTRPPMKTWRSSFIRTMPTFAR